MCAFSQSVPAGAAPVSQTAAIPTLRSSYTRTADHKGKGRTSCLPLPACQSDGIGHRESSTPHGLCSSSKQQVGEIEIVHKLVRL